MLLPFYSKQAGDDKAQAENIASMFGAIKVTHLCFVMHERTLTLLLSQSYVTTSVCRRRTLLAYFGEDVRALAGASVLILLR